MPLIPTTNTARRGRCSTTFSANRFPTEHFHAGRNVSKIAQDKDSAVAILDDGTQFEGDLLIGADGMRSTVRAALFPEVQPRYVGYLAWRGMLDERQATPAFVESCFASLNFSFPKGEELIGYPVAGADGAVNAGHRRFNIMWYRPVAPGADLRNMFTGTDGVHLRDGNSPEPCQARIGRGHERGSTPCVSTDARRCHRPHARHVRPSHLRSRIGCDGTRKGRDNR